jgi:geranylgeranyl diphosphate synthase type I
VRIDVASLDTALASVGTAVDAMVADEIGRSDLVYDDLRQAAFCYLERGGKRLRPLLVGLSAGAAGGDTSMVGPAALAVEVFHTWTLIHDDLIDHDHERRGGPTVHVRFRDRMHDPRPGREGRGDDYGRALAVLGGDYLQGLAIRLLLDGADGRSVSLATASSATRLMQTDLLRDLCEGEMWDVAFSFRPVDEVTEDELLGMYRQKSAALLAYCARVGGMFALDTARADEPLLGALANFAGRCGIAFQIQDDILGVTGDAEKLGKPVGSDIREGKRTVILRHAYHAASAAERSRMDEVLGNPAASPGDIAEVSAILESRGGLQHAREVAEELVKDALTLLQEVPPSVYRDRLADWAAHLVRRRS